MGAVLHSGSVSQPCLRKALKGSYPRLHGQCPSSDPHEAPARGHPLSRSLSMLSPCLESLLASPHHCMQGSFLRERGLYGREVHPGHAPGGPPMAAHPPYQHSLLPWPPGLTEPPYQCHRWSLLQATAAHLRPLEDSSRLAKEGGCPGQHSKLL